MIMVSLKNFSMDDVGPWIGFIFFVLVFGCAIVYVFSDFLFFFDIAPASGTATGYIYYQEKGGIWGLEHVCWKDTPYDYCEEFDPAGQTFEPGKYTMRYDCERFAWAWEKPSLCRIVNATRIGNIS